MNAPVFVDTNVLVYALDAGATQKQPVARAWRDALWRNRLGRISFQVLQEFYVQACRLNPQEKPAIRADIRDLLAWDPVVCDGSVLLDAVSIQDDFGVSFWDSLIIAAALTADCRYLLTEDLQHGQDLRGMVVVNPFKVLPEELASFRP
jgi:predicted nucleic acid-binding protein